VTVNKGDIYYVVCEKIAEISLYDEITIPELHKQLPFLTLRQIQHALSKARSLSWIQYTANQTVCLTYPKGRHVFKKLRKKKQFSRHGSKLRKDIERRIEAKTQRIEKKGKLIRNRSGRVMLPDLDDTPPGERNKSGRLIPEDWG